MTYKNQKKPLKKFIMRLWRYINFFFLNHKKLSRHWTQNLNSSDKKIKSQNNKIIQSLNSCITKYWIICMEFAFQRMDMFY